ncbi:MAG: DNA polymerase III subunit beta [Candidatus Amoebophilus sp. 36-38]|nr:MAG: DNA polymerase III subunit beta [Candidatus Amoebophilus sp. 36-38]
MKFSVSSSTLYKHLVALYGAVVSNPLIPILENFLFEITTGKLKITASDLQTSIITELALDVEGNASIAVPARILLDTLKNLPDQPIKFYIDDGAYSISIKSDMGQYNLAGENATDFPEIPEVVAKTAIHLPADVLKRAIQQTIIATSHDDLKPAINGVYMNFHEGGFTFVATDIHRLIRYNRTGITGIENPPFIIPRKTLLLLNGLLPSDKQEVQISFGTNNVHFNVANIRMVSRLIDEKYPDYENVIPTKNQNKLLINRVVLLASLRRIIVYTNKITHQVKFTLGEHSLEILAEDFNFDNKAKELLDCEYIGEPGLEIGFSAKSLIEMLHNLDAEQVSFHFSQPNKAAVIIPNQQEEGEDILLLIMPITLH